MNDNFIDVNGIKVDKRKAMRIMTVLIGKEKKNLKTKELGKNTMIKQVKETIKGEVECY